MKLSKAILMQYGLGILFLALAFTNLFAFSIGGLRFSFYVVLGAVFIAFATIVKLTMPSLNKSFPFLILLYILFSSAINFADVKMTSVVYSFLFVIYFIYLYCYATEYLKIDNFVKVLKIILCTYFVILIIAQLMVHFDLQVITRPIGYFQGTGQLGVEYNYSTGAYRYFSISSEPSYAAIIVLLTFTTLYIFTEKKRDTYLYALLTLYMLFNFKSAIGFIGVFFYVVSQVKLTNKDFLIFFLVILIGLALFFFTDLGGKSVERIRDIMLLLFTDFNNFINGLNLLDSSAYARIGPFIVYLKQVNFLNYHFYLGHGASTSDAYFAKIIYPEAWNKNMTFNPPFLPGFLYDYGLFGVILVLTFFLKLLKSKSIFYKVIVAILLLNSNFNTQLFWFVIVILTLTNFFEHYQHPKIIEIPKFKGVFNGKRFNI